MDEIRFETDGMTVIARPRRGTVEYHGDWWELDTEERQELMRIHPRYAVATRVYVGKCDANLPQPAYSIRGENAELDREWDVYNEAEIEAQRAKVVRAAAALAEHGIQIDPAQLVHTRTAGCAWCPCSPGMLADDLIRAADGTEIDRIDIDF